MKHFPCWIEWRKESQRCSVPTCETVIHDLSDPLHPVLAIYNGHVSGRTVDSTQDVTGVEQDLHLDSDVVNLLAVTPSGQQTKSSTFTIKGEDYHLGFGINYDFTPLAYANRVLLDLMHTEVDFHSAVYTPGTPASASSSTPRCSGWASPPGR